MYNPAYEAQRAWADQFNEQVKEILQANSMHILKIEIANDEDDSQHATDMQIKVVGGNVAVRLRRDNTTFRDLTIRSRAWGGGKTELDKLREGYGDWYLYGWTHDGIIDEWILVDINKLRDSGLLYRNNLPEQPNPDGRTKFVFIGIGDLKLNHCIVAQTELTLPVYNY